MNNRYIVQSPVEITHIQLGSSKEYTKLLIEESYRLKQRKDRENDKLFKYLFDESEKPVIASSFYLWEESKVFDDLLQNILGYITSTSPTLSSSYEIQNTWIGIYDKGQIARSHNHEPAYKSFCYYISSEEPSTPMIFDDVGLRISPLTDMLIVFPSHMNHSVPPSSGGERIMAAGNINATFEKIEFRDSRDIKP